MLDLTRRFDRSPPCCQHQSGGSVQRSGWRREGLDPLEVVDLVPVVVDLVVEKVGGLGVEMVVCFVVRAEEAEVGVKASQGLSR